MRFWGDTDLFIFSRAFPWCLCTEAEGSDFVAEEEGAFLWDEARLNEASAGGVERLVVEGAAAVEEEVKDAVLLGGEADLKLSDGDRRTEWNTDT